MNTKLIAIAALGSLAAFAAQAFQGEQTPCRHRPSSRR